MRKKPFDHNLVMGFGSTFGFSRQSPLSVSVSSSASNVDGLFHVSVVFGREVENFSYLDITVTNGDAQYSSSDDNIEFVIYVVPNGAGNISVSIPAGVCQATDDLTYNSASNTLNITANTSWLYLSNPAQTHIYYDFRELVGINLDPILVNDPGLNDLSGNSRTALRLNSPMVRTTGAIDSTQKGIVALRSLAGSPAPCVSTQVTGATFLNANFSVNFKYQNSDGQFTTQQFVCGNFDGTNIGLKISFATTGKLKIEYQGAVWDSTNAVLANGQTAITDFFINFNFTTDVLTVKQDGVDVAGSFTTGSMAGLDPSAYACTANFYIGAYNNNGAAASGAASSSIFYFIITLAQGTTSTIRSYINSKKATLELVDTLTDATYLKAPHDVMLSADGTKAYVSGKGDPVLTTVDGSFAIIDITDPSNISLLGGYAGHSDQVDGETVYVYSSTRVFHFVDDAALLFDVSNPASPAKLRTVANGNGVINGVARIGNYLFGANKGGFIDVFDISTVDSFTLVGSYNTAASDSMTGPHDIDVTADGEHIVIVSRPTGRQFAIYKVMNAGSLIPIASWTQKSGITSATIGQSNRVRVMGNYATSHELETGGNNIANINISNLSSPSIVSTISIASLNGGSAGAGLYRNKYDIAATWTGLRIMDVTTNPNSISQAAGYQNDIDFTKGSNQNLHDLEVFTVSNQNYLIVTCQNNGVAVFKINRI